MTDEQVVEEATEEKVEEKPKPKAVSAARIEKALAQEVYVFNRTRTVEAVFRRCGLGREQMEDIVKAILKS